jgi:hypothetical protein
MVSGTRSEGELLVTSAAKASRMTPGSSRSAVTAVLMIAGRGVLHAGDQLLVQHYDKAD